MLHNFLVGLWWVGMPVTAKELSVKELDSRIAAAIVSMSETGQKHNTRFPVGGRPAGLMIQVTPAGSASWIFRIVQHGKRMERGLGPYNMSDPKRSTTLAQARRMAADIKAGRDPVAERKGQERPVTFADVADAFLKANKDGWKNDKHKAQWESTLATWVFPHIGHKPVAIIDRNAIEAILRQSVAKAGGGEFWNVRRETASRVRQRIEKIMAYAMARDYRNDNPAAWRGCLEPLMGGSKVQPKHHASLPYAEASAFMTELRKRDGTAAKALQFTILTAARSGEVRNAEWMEIDLQRKLWTIPANRMKAGREHVVPLSDAAVALLEATPENERSGFVFPGAKEGKPLSDMTLAAVLKRMERGNLTVHGFRSTFREWAGETTGHPREVIEHALAHQLADKAEAAYQRGSLLPKRIRLMADWAGYLTEKSAVNVVIVAKR
ncbi:site-specific integrase [Novosphingobium sp. CCH12-A3]|uniref:tyrosine-type recombinase/integrase n=1 Tax=Novosphingobium sp. CCH12-A3 TaxID=1768752 RepID=UPI0018D2282F|nr:site-specific integrase [Novosphingobium sp. CCH12-A3]